MPLSLPYYLFLAFLSLYRHITMYLMKGTLNALDFNLFCPVAVHIRDACVRFLLCVSLSAGSLCVLVLCSFAKCSISLWHQNQAKPAYSAPNHCWVVLWFVCFHFWDCLCRDLCGMFMLNVCWTLMIVLLLNATTRRNIEQKFSISRSTHARSNSGSMHSHFADVRI